MLQQHTMLKWTFDTQQIHLVKKCSAKLFPWKDKDTKRTSLRCKKRYKDISPQSLTKLHLKVKAIPIATLIFLRAYQYILLCFPPFLYNIIIYNFVKSGSYNCIEKQLRIEMYHSFPKQQWHASTTGGQVLQDVNYRTTKVK